MQTSIFIARLIGPVLLVAGAAALANPRDLHDMARDFMASRALIALAGFLALLGGLAIVNTHNVWTAGWPVLITILGWLSIIAGILRIGFPAAVEAIGKAMLSRTVLLRVAGACQLVLGAVLVVMGYLS